MTPDSIGGTEVSVFPESSETADLSPRELPDVLYIRDAIREFVNTHYAPDTAVSVSDFACITDSLSLTEDLVMNMSLAMIPTPDENPPPDHKPTLDTRWEQGRLIVPLSYLYRETEDDTETGGPEFVDHVYINNTSIKLIVGWRQYVRYVKKHPDKSLPEKHPDGRRRRSVSVIPP